MMELGIQTLRYIFLKQSQISENTSELSENLTKCRLFELVEKFYALEKITRRNTDYLKNNAIACK